MAAKEISVKKYVVRLSGEERERLEVLIRKGKSLARRALARQDQRSEFLALCRALPHNVLLYRNVSTSHARLHRLVRSQQIIKSLRID